MIESFFLIFVSAAVLATVALYTRQPLLVAYVIVGCAIGPYGFGWIADPTLLSEIAEIGIIFLLFLVGMDLQPAKLQNLLTKSILTGMFTASVFFAVGFFILFGFGYSVQDAIIAGLACTFSSTIIGIKLLPTTVLHHRHIGELVVSLLLIQDLVAIVTLLVIGGLAVSPESTLYNLSIALAALPILIACAYLGVRWLLLPLITKFDVFDEYIFLIAIGWCLGIAGAAEAAGLSWAIGAFIAGVSLASSPIAQYITDNLRPLRDFFLVLFFFGVGAGLNLGLLIEGLWPTLLLAIVLVALKPPVFALALKLQKEPLNAAWEVGYRLGQASEFSLLVTYVALGSAVLSSEVAIIVQGATVLTMLISSYLVVFRYPSPMAVSARLRRD